MRKSLSFVVCAVASLALSGNSMASLSITCNTDVDIKPSVRIGSTINFVLGGQSASGGVVTSVQWSWKFTGTGGGTTYNTITSSSGANLTMNASNVGTYSLRAIATVKTSTGISTTETTTYNFKIEPPDDIDLKNTIPQVGGVPTITANVGTGSYFKIPVLCKGKTVGSLPASAQILEDLTAQVFWKVFPKSASSMS